MESDLLCMKCVLSLQRKRGQYMYLEYGVINKKALCCALFNQLHAQVLVGKAVQELED